MGIVMNMPDIKTTGYLLCVRINKVELAPYGIDKPAMQVRMSFGAMEVRTRVMGSRFDAMINDELRMPIYTPTLTDRINIEVIDTKATLASGVVSGAAQVVTAGQAPKRTDKVLCKTTLSFRQLRMDLLPTTWRNMYGVRPLPKQSFLGSIGRMSDESSEDSAYLGRILIHASCEEPRPEERLQVLRLPMIKTRAEVEQLEPRTADYTLRCDLFDGSDLPAGTPFDSIYVVLQFGPHEKRSANAPVTDGVVRFESDQPGKEGYYEQLDEVRVASAACPCVCPCVAEGGPCA